MNKNKSFSNLLKSKFDSNDPNYIDWKSKIDKFERNIEKGMRKKTGSNNFYQAVPNKLYKKLNNIIKLPSNLLDDEYKTENTTKENFGNSKTSKKMIRTQSVFDESMINEIWDMDRNFISIDLKIDPKSPKRNIQSKSFWMNEFLKKPKKNRVKWQSKVYKMEERLIDKPMFEQVEELIDLAAKGFSDWTNSLSSDSKSNITKELIKELFPIGLEGDSSKGLNIAPKQYTTIPNAATISWNLPQFSLENKIISTTKEDRRDDMKPFKYVSFGHTLPMELRHPKPKKEKSLLKPNFPEDLKSKETLFKGITHLRSSQAFIQYLRENPQIQKPKYLKEMGFFNLQITKEGKKQSPFYEYCMRN